MARIKQDISEVREGILEHIRQERQLQDGKWGVQDHEDLQWLAILMEEFGEVAKALLQRGKAAEELVQVAAVAVAWLENLADRGRGIPEGSSAPTPILSQEAETRERPFPSVGQAVSAIKHYLKEQGGVSVLSSFRLEETTFDEEANQWLIRFSFIPHLTITRVYNQWYVGIFVADDDLHKFIRRFFEEEQKGI